MYDYKSFLHRFIVVRFCSSSRSIPSPLQSLTVSHRALCQVPQRVLSRLIGCRFLDALLPSAVVSAGEIPPPVSDFNLCHTGAFTLPTSQRGHFACSRQPAATCLANVRRENDDVSSILFTVLVSAVVYFPLSLSLSLFLIWLLVPSPFLPF